MADQISVEMARWEQTPDETKGRLLQMDCDLVIAARACRYFADVQAWDEYHEWTAQFGRLQGRRDDVEYGLMVSLPVGYRVYRDPGGSLHETAYGMFFGAASGASFYATRAEAGAAIKRAERFFGKKFGMNFGIAEARGRDRALSG